MNLKLFVFFIIVPVLFMFYFFDWNHTKMIEFSPQSSFQLQWCPSCQRSCPSALPKDNYNSTTCSRDAWWRGSGQKVVAFSFYTDGSSYQLYLDGIKVNLKLMSIFYPGWAMRLYYDFTNQHPVMQDICSLMCQNDNLDICNAKHLPGVPQIDASAIFPMNWRFFPTLDPQVDIFLSRDLDSRFSNREVAAVNEWLQSDKPIHSMRDHPYHLVPLLGGAWGAYMTKKNVRGRFKKSWIKILNDPLSYANRSQKGPDQTILKRYVWPWAQKNSVQHDSYLCKVFPGSQPWPTQRQNESNNFIGSGYFLNTTSFMKPCPSRCRKKKSWVYC